MTSPLDRTRARRRPGRPEDPGLESRLFAVVIEQYAETGWAGFSLGRAAAQARVGKAAIYRRWTSKEQLIVDAIMSIPGAGMPDTGSLRGDLIATVEGELADYLSPVGLLVLRAQVEAKAYPDLFGAAMEQFRRNRNQAGHAILAAAVKRGELAAGEDHTPLLDAIGGMTINRFLATPHHRLDALRHGSHAFAESVVDFALRAVAQPDAGDRSRSALHALPERGKS